MEIDLICSAYTLGDESLSDEVDQFGYFSDTYIYSKNYKTNR